VAPFLFHLSFCSTFLSVPPFCSTTPCMCLHMSE
jgi:hypothetical protein